MNVLPLRCGAGGGGGRGGYFNQALRRVRGKLIQATAFRLVEVSPTGPFLSPCFCGVFLLPETSLSGPGPMRGLSAADVSTSGRSAYETGRTPERDGRRAHERRDRGEAGEERRERERARERERNKVKEALRSKIEKEARDREGQEKRKQMREERNER